MNGEIVLIELVTHYDSPLEECRLDDFMVPQVSLGSLDDFVEF